MSAQQTTVQTLMHFTMCEHLMKNLNHIPVKPSFSSVTANEYSIQIDELTSDQQFMTFSV